MAKRHKCKAKKTGDGRRNRSLSRLTDVHDEYQDEQPPETPKRIPETTKKSRPKEPLATAEPTTPSKEALQHKVFTPEMKQGMGHDDAKEVAAAEVSPSKPTAEKLEEENDQVAILEATFRNVKRNERALQAQLRAVTDQIAILSNKWSEGKLDMPRHLYAEQRKKSLLLQQELMSRLALLWSKGAALAGSWASDMITEGVKRDAIEDWAVIKGLLRNYPDLEGGRKTLRPSRTEAQQRLFRTKLESAYGSGPGAGFKMSYCPIAQTRVSGTVAAHIVNVNVGGRTAGALFGDGLDHIWSPRNGLIIDGEYEQLLDNDKALILPVSFLSCGKKHDNNNEEQPEEFVFHLLTKDIGDAPTFVWGYDTLHNRKLKFLNKFRPSRRYLFFKAVVTLLRRRRADIDGHWNDLADLPDIGKTMWATLGPYLKNSILYRFAREVGCLTKQDAERFWAVDTQAAFAAMNISARDERKADGLALEASVGTIQDEEHDGEEEEDDENFVSDDEDPFRI
ncbi:hypothetical protein SEUCBS140593_007294 [Sporothrix eucalyptigena]|uniref:HNH nuclease domain-containing protein n=1 Tax=Sporothrix eucalyptigena TaxID=1812306 RepID=A0ABP0CC30_9PEZI